MERTPRQRLRVLPGFRLALGYSVFYLGILVLLPLSMLVVRSFGMSWADFWGAVSSPRAIAAFQLTFGLSLAAAAVNAVLGLLVAWVLVRYRFPGRSIVDALIDLPFALPTAVAGITLTALYSENGWFGRVLAPLGIQAAFSPLGITIALTFVGLPFVVRTVQPVLEALDPEKEEAAATLGAGRWRTFTQVILRAVLPAVFTGFTLAFARAIGEYGSVVFIAGNMPMKTEIVPLLIMTRLEQFDYDGATALAVVMLLISFVLLLAINALQTRVLGVGRRNA